MQDSASAHVDAVGVGDLEVLGEAFIQDPHELYRRLRVENPVHPVVLPRGLKVWLVTRYGDVRAALADERLRKSAQNIGDLIEKNTVEAEREEGRDQNDALFYHMLNSDPPDHERLRRLVNKAFTSRRIELLRPRIEEITAELLDAIEPGSEVDLLDVFAFPLPITVICELLGIPVKDRDDFRHWTNVLVSGSETAEMQSSAVAMAGYLANLIATKRAEPGEDMMSALVLAVDEGDRLTEGELIAMAFLLLVAGHETTVNLIGNGVLALIENPEQDAAVRADRGLLPGAIEELLRYHGPVNNATLRYTTEPTELGGVLVPADQFVLVSVASANRDGGRFADPERLDFSRDTTGHVAFGHGIHYCLGAPLARLEAEIAFTGLLERFPSVELTVPAGDLRWRGGMIIRGLESLPVRLG